MIKEGDYVYVHTLYKDGIIEGVKEGIYKVVRSAGDGMKVRVDDSNCIHFLYSHQVHKVVPNKINKLLYKELK